jgi:hypothetical protein
MNQAMNKSSNWRLTAEENQWLVRTGALTNERAWELLNRSLEV